MSEVRESFRSWLDHSFESDPPPPEVIAFNFNLYEGPFRIELIGATSYDPDDSDWATDEAWESSPRLFDCPPESWGTGWQNALDFAALLVRDYLGQHSTGSMRLASSQAVTVGFVDGDLVLVGGNTFN